MATPTSTPGGPVLTPEKNGFRYGLYTTAGLCAYTLVAVLAGFFRNITAGALDIAVLILGVVLAIRHFRQVRGDSMPYFGGFGTGIVTALTASILLGLFFLALQAIFPGKLDLTQVQNVFGFEMSTIIAFLSIVLMGTMAGVITSLIAMQLYKTEPIDPLTAAEQASRL